jgi:hypothetical protein
MTVGVFYLSVSMPKGRNRDFQRQVVRLPSGRSVYIRVEEVYAADLEEALDGAKPELGEIVLNACLLP